MISISKPTLRTGWNGKANWADAGRDFGKGGRVYPAGDSRERTHMRRQMSKARRRLGKIACRNALLFPAEYLEKNGPHPVKSFAD